YINGGSNIVWLNVVLLHYHVTSPSSRSKVAGPIPETASRSDNCAKAPCCSRWAMIFSAVAGPTPGKVSNSVESAVLRLTVGLLPARPVPPEGSEFGGASAVV